MQYKFNKHLQNLLPDRPLKILVAVSGGADSMCLLHLLLNSDLNLDLSIAHMNFNLRGAESDADEQLVREWAAGNNVKIFVESVDTVQYAEQHSVSIEMAARDLRYAWFYSLKKEHGFDYIALAHHANDNAETLLLNMVRGSGISGICGMKDVDEERSLLRPLLYCTRDEIEKYVSLKNIPYRVDCTNSDIKFHRNRVRHVVIPELEKMNPSVVGTLNRNMKYFSEASGILKELLEEKKKVFVNRDNGADAFLKVIKNRRLQRYMKLKYASAMEACISIEKLLEEKYYRYWLYEILWEYEFNPSQIEDMADALLGNVAKRIISKGYTAVKERGYIKIYKTDGILSSSGAIVEIGEFDGAVEVNLAGSRILLEVFDNEVCDDCKGLAGKGSDGSIVVSFDKLKFPLMLRNPRKGDKWRPFGMNGAKKLSDYFTDIKMDSVLKECVPVLCTGSIKNNPDNIICLPGLEISDYYKISSSDKKVLRITLLD